MERVRLGKKRERVSLEKRFARERLDDAAEVQYAARKVLINAFLYYVMDAPTISDGEYDRLSRYVADHWDKLNDDQKWALRNPNDTRAGGSHIRFASQHVYAAFNAHKYATGKFYDIKREDWRERKRDGCRFVTCSVKPVLLH